jgi:hypothetical protein
MSTTFFQLAFDAANAADQAEFWAQATGGKVEDGASHDDAGAGGAAARNIGSAPARESSRRCWTTGTVPISAVLHTGPAPAVQGLPIYSAALAPDRTATTGVGRGRQRTVITATGNFLSVCLSYVAASGQ